MDAIRAAEAAAGSVRLDLRTEGAFPGGEAFQTEGTLRVLRGEHPRLLATMSYRFGADFAGRMATLKTPDGVWILEDSPTFGAVYLEMDRALMRDLEWAAEVLGRKDEVPGVDRREAAPLGSAMLAELGLQYDLRLLSRKDRDGQPGRWIGGDLRQPQAGGDGELPQPDRVELFVRDGDAAILETIHFQQGKPVQRIAVTRLEVNRPMDQAEFVIDAGDRRPRPVKEHAPAWSQIERILRDADQKAPDQRPSLREKPPEKPAEKPGDGKD